MASNRHLGRIIVLQALYEYEFRTKAGDTTVSLDTILAKDIEPYSRALGDTEFVYTLGHDVAERFADLDAILQPLATEWPLDTIAGIDRNILRMGLHELQSCAETVPPKVAINEAVELAKAFGSDSSSRFINGVLGTVYRQIYGLSDAQSATPAASSTSGANINATDVASAAGVADATVAPDVATAPASEPASPEEHRDQEEITRRAAN